MGAFTSRQNAGVEEVAIGVNHAYRYPPKQGNYFSSHFIMGGEKFDTALPEMYLFGENMDLNFLGSRPAPFPYPAPSASEPSKTLKAFINIRKESLRFVKVIEETPSLKDSEPVTTGNGNTKASNISEDAAAEAAAASETTATATDSATSSSASAEVLSFNIEFTFDCDVRCAITIMYFCAEESTSQGISYIPRDPSMNSETYHYKRGANQQFSQTSHVFIPSLYSETDLLYSFDREVFPVVVHCIAEEGEDPRQSQATIGIVEKHSDGFVLKALKQKLFVHGLCYLLQEIYGIENKNSEIQKGNDDEGEDNGAECVICMCDLRDTLILPCRHLCLCNCCADSLRFQANNCPICRAPFRALLQIKALQKNTSGNPQVSSSHDNGDIPAGYEAVSLIEALNGPSVAPPVQPTAPTNSNQYVKLSQNPSGGVGCGNGNNRNNTEGATNVDLYAKLSSDAGGRGDSDPLSDRSAGNLEDSTTQTDNTNGSSGGSSLDGGTQMRMSVLLAADESEEGNGVGENRGIYGEAALEASLPNKVKGSTAVGVDHGPRRRRSRKRLPPDSTPSGTLVDSVYTVNELKSQDYESKTLLKQSEGGEEETVKHSPDSASTATTRDTATTVCNAGAAAATIAAPRAAAESDGEDDGTDIDGVIDPCYYEESPKRKKVRSLTSVESFEQQHIGDAQYLPHPLQLGEDSDENDSHSNYSAEMGAVNPLHAGHDSALSRASTAAADRPATAATNESKASTDTVASSGRKSIASPDTSRTASTVAMGGSISTAGSGRISTATTAVAGSESPLFSQELDLIEYRQPSLSGTLMKNSDEYPQQQQRRQLQQQSYYPGSTNPGGGSGGGNASAVDGSPSRRAVYSAEEEARQPVGGGVAGAGALTEQPSLPSMPGTPLSNASGTSVISNVSDVSSASAGSNQALLQHPHSSTRATML
uniref:RING-type E3 ubiquitin transferase n=2 Tax=Hirondellea gigas TaxID=1518452 RepID=A0A6A7G4Y0_9CRUS